MPISLAEFGAREREELTEVVEGVEEGRVGLGRGSVEGGEDCCGHRGCGREVEVGGRGSGRVGDDEGHVEGDVRLGRDEGGERRVVDIESGLVEGGGEDDGLPQRRQLGKERG